LLLRLLAVEAVRLLGGDEVAVAGGDGGEGLASLIELLKGLDGMMDSLSTSPTDF
jgi:hypothetical protein